MIKLNESEIMLWNSIAGCIIDNIITDREDLDMLIFEVRLSDKVPLMKTYDKIIELYNSRKSVEDNDMSENLQQLIVVFKCITKHKRVMNLVNKLSIQVTFDKLIELVNMRR